MVGALTEAALVSGPTFYADMPFRGGLVLTCELGVAQWAVMKMAFSATRKTELALGPSLIAGMLSLSALLG